MALARQIAPVERVVPVVLEQDRPWWESAVRELPPGNIVEQPFDRGTGVGILLAFLRIFRRDPAARIALLSTPSRITGEHALLGLALGLDALEIKDHRLIVIGTPADERDHPRCWIVPCPGVNGEARRVSAFTPASDDVVPSRLLEEGAVVDAGIALSTSIGVLELFRETHPEIVQSAIDHLKGNGAFSRDALDELYPFLPTVDFATQVLAKAPRLLRVVLAPKPLRRSAAA